MSTPNQAEQPRQKTVLAPCMGVGKIVASVTRRASYIIKGQCPEDIELLSLPALLAGDPEERKLIQDHPTIIIDGCALRCAAQIFQLYGVTPAAKVEVNQVMKEKKLGPGKTRKELEETGKRLSDFTAERVLQALRDEGVSADFVPLDDLSQPPPEAGCGCPHRLPVVPQASRLQGTEVAGETPAVRASSDNVAAAAEAAAQGVCASGPAGELTPAGKYKVNAVTVMPCQGIKRTGGRVTQRAAYHVVEDRFLGKSQVLCISALAAGVPEDVVMLEQYPTVAVNGCGKRCASIAAEHHGIPAVDHVELHELDPDFKGEEYCLEPDLTDVESHEALKLADFISASVEKLVGQEIDWQPRPMNLHGLVHEPGKINAQTGFKDGGKGYLVRLAEAQLAQPEIPAAIAAPVPPPAPPVVKEEATSACDDYPGLQKVARQMFKPKPRAERPQ